MRPSVSEADVIAAALVIAQTRGWRPVRMQSGLVRSRDGQSMARAGEVGMPGYLFIKYMFPLDFVFTDQVIWVEFKRPGATPSAAQLAWHGAERARGARVEVIDSIERAKEVF